MLKTRFEGFITENEFEYITKELGREPNEFEMFLFSATYSEHCSYKHSRELLKLLPREGAIFYNENAGGIEIGEHAILFKMESHNHPCAVEPFNGAATGIGGIIRDVLAMNARPIALCNSLKFENCWVGKPNLCKTSHLSPLTSYLISSVIKGISEYGNCIGVPTVSTEVLFDDCFSENPLVNVAAIGLAKTSDILTSNTAKSGLKLILVGSATMRDGMGGAAFASKKLSDEKAEDKISIQIANPFMKKKLIEACLEIFNKKLVVACQDCGAAGILSSTSEVAYKSGCGVEINLEKVHLGDKSIKDFEIMLSETQERMLFVVKEEKIQEISKILEKFELEYSIIGKTISEKRYIVKNNHEKKADLPTDLLVNPPKMELNFIPRPLGEREEFQNEERVLEIRVRGNESIINGNCPEIYEQYDHTVGGRTQFQPAMCTPPQPAPSRGEGVISDPQFNSLWIWEENCFLGVYTFSAVIQQNPFDEVYEAILLAAKSLKEKGFRPAGITNCLNFANPEIPPTMYEFRETILAMKKACEELKIPVCSGNVSFYNESSFGRIKNTPSFTMLGLFK
ncbi:MAG: phosphoribosylformylglycinamidine synthase subunit PurL [Candidatus Gastranaerophilales bacterium]|nr:phosphoribosylformylglycinamidine synthase subunit PurL [Candidatus Gastranaerophilales bacterium]